MKTKSNLALRNVEKKLRAIQPKGDPKFHARYVGGVGHPDRAPDEQSRLTYLGLMTGQLDEVAKSDFGFDPENADQVWDQIWTESKIFEALSLAIGHFLQPKKFERAYDYWPMFKRWAVKIDNWAMSDCLSKLIAQALETHPTQVLPTLKKWTTSPNPWLRRQSVVGLFYYKNSRKKFPPKEHVFQTLSRLLDDPHFYVQKGVGWTLREAYQAWPEDQVKWVKKNAPKIPTAGYTATVEKYPAALKAEIKALRKTHRAKKAK